MQILYTSSDFDKCRQYIKDNHLDDDYIDIEGIEDDGVNITRFAVKKYTFEEIYFMNGGSY
jgi:hypothetical protein